MKYTQLQRVLAVHMFDIGYYKKLLSWSYRRYKRADILVKANRTVVTVLLAFTRIAALLYLL